MAELNLCFNLFSNKYANERIMRKGKHWATSLARIWGFGTYSRPVTIIIIIIIIISLAEKTSNKQREFDNAARTAGHKSMR